MLQTITEYFIGGVKLIRKLIKTDYETVMELVGKKPAENLFIIGDIEAYGFESDVQELWGQFEAEKLVAILLRYDQNYIPYSEGAYDVEDFANLSKILIVLFFAFSS